MYKLMTLPVLVLAMVGCGSNFRTIPTDPVCTPYPWFLDADEDGWGDPNTNGIVQCDPDGATGFTARNNRDCDDSNPDITGRVGSLCPADVVIGDGNITQFSIGTTEYLLANVSTTDPADGTSVVWPEYARDVCSPEGWGGTYVIVDEDGTIHEDLIDESRDPAGLFVANADEELVAIKAHMPGAQKFWATWINATGPASVVDDPATESIDETVVGHWSWDVSDAGSALPFSLVAPFCDNVTATPTDSALLTLALIQRQLAGDAEPKLCLGTPDQVWGRYFKDVVTALDHDGDGLQDAQEDRDGDGNLDPGETDPNDADTDGDGIGDGQEVDVLDTDPKTADDFPVLGAVEHPLPAFQTELAYFVCERDKPDLARFEMHDLPGLDGP